MPNFNFHFSIAFFPHFVCECVCACCCALASRLSEMGRQRERFGVQMKNDHQHFTTLFSLESFCMIYIRCALHTVNSSYSFYCNLARNHILTLTWKLFALALFPVHFVTHSTVHSVVALSVHNQKQSKVDRFLVLCIVHRWLQLNSRAATIKYRNVEIGRNAAAAAATAFFFFHLYVCVRACMHLSLYILRHNYTHTHVCISIPIFLLVAKQYERMIYKRKG